jgi:hypothetical protein
MAHSTPPHPRDFAPAARARPRFGLGWFWQVLYILYCLEVGVFLLFLPWMSLWDANYLVYLYPKLRPILANPYLKGAVLGLGIVNVLIGIQEIAQFKKGSDRRVSH